MDEQKCMCVYVCVRACALMCVPAYVRYWLPGACMWVHASLYLLRPGPPRGVSRDGAAIEWVECDWCPYPGLSALR